ncbi:hypothetical protein ABI59_13625 [Acidobacteria bacterium Mor1]|nr:hypothetical protein ABI59_13625 [Acidobacteria bacterium Mor1]
MAVIGAGPVGLEAALYAARLGHDVQVYERGDVGGSVRLWGHVTLFSPWHLNRSKLGEEVLRLAGVSLAADDHFPRGQEYVEQYLEPLADSPQLRGRVHPHTRVVQIGRDGIGKSDALGGGRERHAFRLLLEGPDGERIETADVVLDCSGTYGNAPWLGNGNVPALGERAASDRIAYVLRDLTGSDRRRYEGKRVLLVGSGFSAATAIDGLLSLRDTEVVWVTREESHEPYTLIDDDPLPERARLSAFANGLAKGEDSRVTFHAGSTVDRFEPAADGLHATLRTPTGPVDVEVDEVLAHVGYVPDSSIYRELQVHECYATGGPMKLAATLLAGSSADCLAQTSAGPDVLRNPEPDFYILGAKSYGRNSHFLIRLGLDQIREVFTLIEASPELDLYAA